MKKILTLICAVALVSGASAQVQQAREVGAPLSKNAKMDAVSPMLSSPVKGAVKDAVEDTLFAEGAFHSLSGKFGGGYTATGLSDWSDVNYIPTVWWPMGTGWANYFYGSGEIGYVFDFSDDGWFHLVGGFNYKNKGVTGAISFICRAKSTVEKINSKDMPLYYKLYTSPMGQVKPQEAFDDLTSTLRCEETIDVHYPVDPDNYVSVSNTVYVPLIEPEDPDDMMDGDRYGARFETPGIAGDFFCISVMFPNEQNDEDTLWNATMLTFMEPNSTAKLKSENPGHMYVVYDFNNQHMWGQNDGGNFIYARERADWMLPDTLAQPNSHSVIVPMASWYFTDNNQNRTGSRQDGEAYLAVILADGVDIERGAAYDKYVEVKINPAIDHTVIAATDKIKHIELYNLNGKLVKTQACNDYFETISLSGLTSGMYIAKVTTEAGIANKKIMVR